MTVSVGAAAPGVFTDAEGHAAALNADGSRNDPQHPAASGSIVSLFFTGQGLVDTPLEDGAPAPVGPVISATSPVSATVGGLPAEVRFTGLAPGYAGLAQINLKVPVLAAGVYPVVIKIGSATSNSARLTVSAL